MKIAAVVVTYNRRDLLERTLVGLANQTRVLDHVYVIDNASTDGTAEYLRAYLAGNLTVDPTQTPQLSQDKLTVIRMKKNIGGAGGFAFGIDRAVKAGYDAVWVMDDDTVARPGALAKLEDRMLVAQAENNGEMPSFACSTVVWTNGDLCEMNTPVPTWDFPRPITRGHDYLSVQSCSFVSCLVTAEAVRAVGLPYAEYFIWYDDAEYTQRLSRFRPGIYVPASIVDHLLAQNRGVNYGDVNEGNIWKFEYGLRNQVSAAWSLRNPMIIAQLATNLFAQLRGSGVPYQLRWRLAKAIARGLVFHPQKRYVD